MALCTTCLFSTKSVNIKMKSVLSIVVTAFVSMVFHFQSTCPLAAIS